MSSFLYKAPPRSGKSYHVVVQEIIPAILQRRQVFTNVAGLNLREISWCTGVPLCEMRVQQVSKAWLEYHCQVHENDPDLKTLRCPLGCLIVVDEPQMVWPNREWKDTPQTWINFLQYHGHADIDIVFMTQDVEQLDKAVRRLCNEYYDVLNNKWMALWGISNSYTVVMRLSLGGLIVNKKDYYFEQKYFRCYKSAVQTTQQLSRKRPMPRVFKFAVLALLFFAGALYNLHHRHFGIIKSADSVSSVPASLAPHDFPGVPRPAGSVSVSSSTVVPFVPVPSEKIASESFSASEKSKCSLKPWRMRYTDHSTGEIIEKSGFSCR